MSHTHVDAHPEHRCVLNSGGHYEVCQCGATRHLKKDNQPVLALTGGRFNAKNDKAGWHTCDLCTPINSGVGR